MRRGPSPETELGPVLLIGATDLELAPLRQRLARATDVDGAWSRATLGRLGDLEVLVQAVGVGKVRTAAGLSLAIAAWRPRAVVQVGIGGAYLGSFLSVGLAMLADVDMELDLGIATGDGWADLTALRVPLLPPLGDAAAAPPPGGREPAAGAAHGATHEAAREAACHPGLTTALADGCGLPRGRFATLDAVTADIEVGAALQRRFDVAIESMEGAAAATVAARLDVPFAQLRAVSNLVGERDRARWDLRGAVRTAADAAAAALMALPDHPRYVELVDRPRGSTNPVRTDDLGGRPRLPSGPERGKTT
jgi:futalosine hydrolase